MLNANDYLVFVDAAFLKHEQRQPFQVLADRSGVPYIILEITAPAEVLRQRIVEREHDVSDADLAVLEHQLSNWKSLHEDELQTVITVDTTEMLDVDNLIGQIKRW